MTRQEIIAARLRDQERVPNEDVEFLLRENRREEAAQQGREITPADDGHEWALLVAQTRDYGGGGFSYRKLRKATEADVAQLAPRPESAALSPTQGEGEQ